MLVLALSLFKAHIQIDDRGIYIAYRRTQGYE